MMPVSRTLPALLDELAGGHPEREAVVGAGRRYTYALLREETRAVAKGLHALGVRKGDKVAILMGNTPEWVVAELAITMLGGVLVAVNTWATLRELEYMLRHSDASVLVTVERFLKTDYLRVLEDLQPHAERVPSLRKIVCVAEAPPEPMIPFAHLAYLGRSITNAALEEIARAVRPEDLAYLLYTSGSTSLPKGVQLHHSGLIENTWNIGERMHVTGEDRFWLAVSLFWAFGCGNALPNALTHGACIVLQEHFDAGEALRLIEEERCTVMYATANMSQALYDHPGRAKRDLTSLRTGATLGTPEQIMRAVDLGAREICQVYGLTETYGNCAVTDSRDPLEQRLNTVGTPLPSFTMRIVDVETERVLAPGQVGEVRVKGYVLSGYYKDSEKSADAFDADGFFRTGDLGVLDENNRLRFRGRIKEMVKTGGINVAPVEVEEILMSHPAVESAFVIGLPDPVLDEVLAAVVLVRSGHSADRPELDRFCRDALAAYKVPRLFRFAQAAELPLTTTGKLQKNRLWELFGAAGSMQASNM